MPRVRLVDMAAERRRHGTHATAPLLSAPLLQALRERLEAAEQSLLLLNRRGYAPVLQCLDCGWHSQCPHCSAWRVFHKSDRTLRCHHCGMSQRVPQACPDCGNQDLVAVGEGTQRLEEQLAQALPGARLARIDADVARVKGGLEEQLARVHGGEVDILVGTQMVAKGHDFRRMTLVAAVNPDGALYSHDFRAPERLFALLMQAAGRAGRDAAQAARSEMLIQTWSPAHPLYAAVQADDYGRFAQAQLEERRVAGLPPWTHLALLRAQARTAQGALDFLRAAAEAARALAGAEAVRIYPPVPAAMARVANVERAQMLIESSQRPLLQEFLRQWQASLHALMRDRPMGGARILRWALDVDPLEI
jgi:primosomal protein N' (replication factor Y)